MRSLVQRPLKRPRAASRFGAAVVGASAQVGVMAFAAEVRASDPTPLDDIGPNVVDAFAGYGLPFHAGAVASTVPLVATGADHSVRVAIQLHFSAPAYGDAAYYGGYALPVVLPVSLYLGGLLASSSDVARAGAAMLQAVTLTFGTTVFLKVATGRPFPMHGGDPSAPDRLRHPEYAKEFTPFGFGGRYAWPSGHTAASISMAAALTAYTGSVPLGLASYGVAFGIGAGMMVGDHHWASDVIAGALLGHAIGWSVGRGFARHRTREGTKSALTIVPLAGGTTGAALVGVF